MLHRITVIASVKRALNDELEAMRKRFPTATLWHPSEAFMLDQKFSDCFTVLDALGIDGEGAFLCQKTGVLGCQGCPYQRKGKDQK